MSENPYAPPQAEVLVPGGPIDEEAIRRNCLKHEASVRSIGLLYWLAAIWILGRGVIESRGLTGVPDLAGYFAAIFGLVGIFTLIGVKLRELAPGVRMPVGIISGLGLLAFPYGTVINLYILYLIFGRKGRRVFAEDYKAVIAATPHIRYRTSPVVWIFLGLLVVLLTAIALASR